MNCKFCHRMASQLIKKQNGADVPVCSRCGRALARLGVPARQYLRPGDLFGTAITTGRRQRRHSGVVWE